ncbi:MAG: nuclear transport factor 2 family protein [Rhodospirillaceae bacterium]|nr:nuclear transport factor 2 family protein [Rhodospirillaceae bacterium]
MRAVKLIAVLSMAASLWATAAVAAADTPQVQKDIETVIHDMAGRWAKNTWSTIAKDLWDPKEPTPMYLAEEEAGWLVGWDALNQYFNPKRAGEGFMQAAEYNASNIQVHTISDDLAVATWNIYWQMKMRPAPAIAERLRATGIFRKTSEGWKFIHYAEAPKSPSAYITDLYNAQVSPEFRERVKGMGGGRPVN